MPNVELVASTAASGAQTEAIKQSKEYTKARIGDIDENTSVKDYVDNIHNTLLQDHGQYSARFTNIETNVNNNATAISTNS
jgi:hypothetical protein